MKLERSKKTENGFTLVEFLVAVTIITIFSVIILANYEPGEQNLALQRTVHQVAQDIRRTQEMSMSARKSSACSGDVPTGGYGIYFYDPVVNQTSYVLFADCNADENYSAGEETGDPIEIEEGVGVYTLISGGAGVSTLTIIFKPPDPIVVSNAIVAATSSVTFQGENDRFGVVSVNEVGLIETK